VSGKRGIALVAIVGLALALGATASANIDASFTAHTASVAGDCNGNGVGDFSEPAFGNRDDDADGFCNSVDVCPYEASAVNDGALCQMQAITVPFRPDDLAAPHPTYSGASITLKGIARYGGDQYMWDYGDGTTPMLWSAILDPYNLGVRHTYAGAVGQEFVATLMVRDSADPGVVASATYPIRIEQSSDLTDPAQLDVRARMAADASLWWLHTTESRGRSGDGPPFESQPYGSWNEEGTPATCAALDAFETRPGSTPGAGWRTDPYVEDVRLGLNLILAQSSYDRISGQQYGNPDVNGNGNGIRIGGADDTYTNGVCAMALADSATPDRLAATGPPNIYGRSYADIAQDAVDWFAFGQMDDVGLERGGWGYYANESNGNAETFRWPVFAMDSAEREMGATVPAFVRQNIPFFLSATRISFQDADNGGWDETPGAHWPSAGFTGAGIAIHGFLGDSPSHPEVLAGLGFLYRNWNAPPAVGIFGNLGDSDAMYTVARAMSEAAPGGLSQITDFDYTHGVTTGASFDWYHGALGSGHEGYATDLVSRQQSSGQWNDTVSAAGAHGEGPIWSTAWDSMVLNMEPGAPAAPAAPVAQIVSPSQVVNGPLPVTVQLDGSRSSDPQGRPLTYSWTVSDGGTLLNPTSAIASRLVDHYGSFDATLTVSNGFLSSSATAHVDVVDKTAPSFTSVPQNITLQAGPNIDAQVAAWLASAAATDDDPDHPTATVTNDFQPNSGVGGVGAGNSVLVTWTATDSVGNSAQKRATVTVVGDTTAPSVDAVVTGTLGDNGWYTGDVHVSWQIVDAESSITSRNGCEAADVTADTTAAGTTFSCSATSDGGTSPVRTVTIKRDATPPSITAARTPAPNAAGWNADDVTVTYSCDDDLSGLAQCPAAQVLHEGAAQTATGTAKDKAGNSASASVNDINVDKTGPSLSGVPTSSPNVNGWYRSDVPVHWSCSDALSGIEGSCPADSSVTGEGSGLTAAASVTDRAGNVTGAASSPVRIDRSPPATSASAPTGWTNAGVTVALSAIDNLSGIAATYYSLDGGPAAVGNSVAIDSEGTHTLAYWSVDGADNVEPTKTVTVKIDRSAPTITHALSPSPNSAGWNNTDVSVSFTCGDADSGIAFCTALQLLTGEGANQQVAGQARDNAGNATDDLATVSIDKTAPSVTAAADRAPNGNGWYSADVVVTFDCSDALSGVSSCPAAVTVKEGAPQSGSGSATDVAGNSGSGSVGGLNVDETPPTVTYSGNAGTYTIDQIVSITCAASDALSGVDSTTCADISGPAASFGLGAISRSASATDLAGNVGSGSVSFMVGVSCDAVKGLIGQWVSNKGIASALTAKIDAVCSAPNANAKSGKLGAFDNQVAAQTGKAITKEHADLLEQYAGAL
jgi:uncharacterized protein YjbJ (UPF0337 family)